MKARLATPIGKLIIGEYISGVAHRHEAAVGKVSHDEVFDGGQYQCDECKEMFKPDTWGTRYDTPSGKLEPGCLWWNNDLPENYYWDNHKGPHLYAMTPNGHFWNIDSRASNCGSPNDRLHRCWVRTGKVPNIHVGKDGHTCVAGAGSIWANKGEPDEWHGYLHHGEFHT